MAKDKAVKEQKPQKQWSRFRHRMKSRVAFLNW